MATLELHNLSKVYNRRSNPVVGVEDLDIELDEGNLLVLVGPSGCGKSTTLRSIAGLEQVTGGEIRIGNEVVNKQKPMERDIAMVFQNYALYPHMTSRQNISFGLKMTTDLSEEKIEERVESVAEMMDIDHILEKPPGELSGGQQQRVALGRAIVREPQVFLLDEPLSNLDAKLRAHMRTEIKELQQELDITTVYVTHDQTEAMTMGDKIAILNDGELQQIGTPLECYHKPANRFVASFIGEPSMNFFETQLERDRLIGNGLEYPLSDKILANAEENEQITLGIRPEDIEITTSPNSHSISGNVNVVETLGSTNYIYVNIEGQETIVEVPGNQYVNEKTDLIIQLPEEAIHLFDTETGEALHNTEIDKETITQSEIINKSDPYLDGS